MIALSIFLVLATLWLVGFSECLLWLGVPMLSAAIVAALLH